MSDTPTLRLWSFQSMDACEQLDKIGNLQVEWRFTPINWRPTYEWMTREMVSRGIEMDGHAPVWAWHSCEGQQQSPPTLGTARNQLTDKQILEGVCIVEFDAPENLALLSSYNRFNDLLDNYLEQGFLPAHEDYLDMFDIWPLREDDSIQAALPRIEKDWVVDIRHLEMKPDRWDYDWAKVV